MKKRIITVFLMMLVFSIMLSISVSANSESGTCGENLQYSLDKNTGILTISGSGPMYDFKKVSGDDYAAYSGDMHNPWGNSYDGNWCMRENTDVKKIVIEPGVTTIGHYAFAKMVNLTEVVMADTVVSIGNAAFKYCDNLKTVNISKNLQSLGEHAFAECKKLDSHIVIPDGVTSIGEYTFYNCVSLKEILLPDTITSVATYAFFECMQLSQLNLTDSLTSVGEWAFCGCEKAQLPYFPKNLTSVGMGAFADMDALTEVTIPEGLSEIFLFMFSDCDGLTKVVIPSNITKIGTGAFRGCDVLSEIHIPESVSVIESEAFSFCTGLKEIKIPSSVSEIKWGTFEGCTGLTRLEFNHEISLGVKAFSGCSGLTELVFTERFTVEDNTFEGCTNIAKITLPMSVNYNMKESMYGMESLQDVYCPGGPEHYRFDESKASFTIHYYYNCRHLDQTILPAKEATCNRTGLTEGSMCSFCGKISVAQEEVPMLEHTATVVPGVPATCTEAGLSDGSECSRCRRTLEQRKELPALGHDYEENILNQPTCSAYGLAKYICKHDESHFYVDAVAPTNDHDYDAETGVCSKCDAKDPDFMENPFIDVAKGDWFCTPVLWAYRTGVTGGKTANTFAPNEGCTRAQVVTFIWAANGKPEPQSMENIFMDVADNAWYLKPVLWAVENGITGGIADGLFGPEQTCTRAQIVTFLYAAEKKPAVSGDSQFADVADNAWYAKPVLWAAENDITGGIGDGKFGPDNVCTRAQVVTFLYKVYGNK